MSQSNSNSSKTNEWQNDDLTSHSAVSPAADESKNKKNKDRKKIKEVDAVSSKQNTLLDETKTDSPPDSEKHRFKQSKKSKTKRKSDKDGSRKSKKESRTKHYIDDSSSQNQLSESTNKEENPVSVGKEEILSKSSKSSEKSPRFFRRPKVAPTNTNVANDHDMKPISEENEVNVEISGKSEVEKLQVPGEERAFNQFKSAPLLSKIISPKQWLSTSKENKPAADKSLTTEQQLEEVISTPQNTVKLDAKESFTTSTSSGTPRLSSKQFLSATAATSDSLHALPGSTSTLSFLASEKLDLLKKIAVFKDLEDTKFYNDEDHHSFLVTAKHNTTVDIPEPILTSVKMEVLPILLDTLKQYKVDLGKNHKLTLELIERIRHIHKELSNVVVKDGEET